MARFSHRGVWCAGLGLVLMLAAIPAARVAADDAVKSIITRSAPANPDATTVDLFGGMASGEIAVKFIPKNSAEARVLIENKTDKPLSVKLPDTFAGVPVLAQPAGGGNGGGGGGAQPQGGGMGGGGMGGGGGMFNIPPEKIGQIRVATVCLEHGKGEPRPSIPYEIKPLESVTDKAEVCELCRMLGTGKLNQRVAQVATWHFNNGMSWQELANKQLRHADGTSEPYFSPAEIQGAVRLADMATKTAEQRKQQQQPQGSSANTSTPHS